MRTTHVVSAVALAVSLALGALGAAAVFAQAPQTDARVAAKVRLSIAQVHEKLVALGYKDIDEIEREREVYEVEARTSAGERVKLYVDAGSGEILRTKSGARDRGRGSEGMGTEADRGATDCRDRRRRDDTRAQTLPSEVVGWYLADIYGRMQAAGI